MIPERLKPGDAIGFISPSHVAEVERYKPFIASVEELGFRVKTAKNLYKSTYGYAATELERAADFNEMATDPEVKCVLFGGGEGGNELLPYIDFEAVRANPKIYTSFSDSTDILNAIYKKTGLVTYYGPCNMSFVYGATDYNKKQFINRLVKSHAGEFEHKNEWLTVRPGKAEGKLIGGYLRNFAMMLGRGYADCDGEGYLLFLEDHKVFGDMSYISGMLSHVEQYGLFDRACGLIFGCYDETVNPQLIERLGRIGDRYSIPVVYTPDFGHGGFNGIIPLGGEGELDADKRRLIFK